jgi:hypothetical protein
LEQSGNYYVSLLAHGSTDDKTIGPTGVTVITSKVVSPGSCSLFNETCIGNYTGVEEVVVRLDADQEMQQVVDDHRRSLG